MDWIVVQGVSLFWIRWIVLGLIVDRIVLQGIALFWILVRRVLPRFLVLWILILCVLGLGVVHKSLCPEVSRRYPRSGNTGLKVGTLKENCGGYYSQIWIEVAVVENTITRCLDLNAVPIK